ncbi:SAM-dependent methyltransferase [Methanobacterium petrolearium]|uniref:SAM-dependent methyltransferase n=1 Tax=Methanobacterium petrolearium TaxID=710190 RepID=UPI001AE9C2A5|nr:class I SAM-dependent methyltransferase [Methanobacterium petrolearium]MBP1946495.1 methyltransferase (TIGR00027 family) [Methanobacterium petrolearium]BDZ69833.1 SAM-dependent methyltransferase [Methanobacterium petrolearium]
MEISKMQIRRKDTSGTAEEITFHRVIESAKEEEERICYDPYAVHFIGPELLKFFEATACNYPEAKARLEEMYRLFPGTQNSIVARVRYFDDYLHDSIEEGIEQLVILGAGYDTRAYRIEGIKEHVKVFEVDYQGTQQVKMEKIKEIFGSLPSHVKFVNADVGSGNLFKILLEHEYNPSQKTLFIMEGLIYYLPPEDVKTLLSSIVQNSSHGSKIILDYFPQSMVDGTCELEVGNLIHERVKQSGEPLKFGIKEGTVEKFLKERGFSHIQNVTSDDYKKAYFYGKNENREVCSLYSFVHAMVEH